MIRLVQEIRETLKNISDKVDNWFNKPEEARKYKPLDNGWTIDQILEHISLTNHFLLILIDKGARKALENANKLNLQTELDGYEFEKKKLDEIGLHKSFEWIRPEHMEPKGEKSSAETREIIGEQFQQCSKHLENMPDGEGILHKTTMTVNNLGKIDVYEYIYFLAKHAERHLTQMEKNEEEFLSSIR